MFNPDGTEDFCGNGLRCASAYAHSLGWVGESFSIKHLDRTVTVQILADGTIQMNLGQASYDPDQVPVVSVQEIFRTTVWSGMVEGQALSFFGSALTTGSTHVVIPVASLPDDATFRSVSAAIEKADKFPKHTSVIWVKEQGTDQLKIRIWERGAGETFGCGTGSTAAAADFLRRRNKGGTIEVQNPGGTVWVSGDTWDAALSIRGKASLHYEGVYPLTSVASNSAAGTCK